MKKTLLSTLLLSLSLTPALTGLAFASEKEVMPDVQYMPKGGYKPTVPTTFVPASAEKELPAGYKIADLDKNSFSGATTLQRLTSKTYWVQVGVYNTVFYVGDKGVLLLDPLADGAGTAVLAAIKSVTDKPVTALVYSHDHADHIGDAQIIIDATKAAGATLRIIASDATANKMAYLNSSLPRPTETVAFADGSFDFEGLTVQAQGFVRAAHTDDSAAWLLQQEKVLHAPDMTNPNQMAYLGFGGSENAVYLAKNLAQLAQGDWVYFSGGHGNVGSHADIKFMQDYLVDLYAAVGKALETVPAGDYFNEKMHNHQGAAHSWSEAVATSATTQLRPKYGEFYGFEASVPHQAELALEAISSYK